MKRERGKKDSISFKKEKKTRNGRNVENYAEDWMSVSEPCKTLRSQMKILQNESS